MSETSIPARAGDRTAEIQAALDQGGRIVLETGTHLSRGLRLGSDTELHLSDGAELRFVPDYDAYAATSVSVVAEDSDRAMIVSRGARNISITGSGRLFGDGLVFTRGEDHVMGTRIPSHLRPRLLVLEDCVDVTLSGIRVECSPMWTLHFVGCCGVRIEKVCVENDLRMPNTDGIVIDACTDVVIRDCDIRTADDGIVLKTSERGASGVSSPCEKVSVSGCRIESRSCAIKIGTESFADFRDIDVSKCKITGSNRGLGIFSRDGGGIRNIRFSDIDLDCDETPDGFWGSGEALTITVIDRRPEVRRAGAVQNVMVEDVRGRMQGAINFYAERQGGISNVSLKRLSLEQVAGPLGTALRYDLRPTPGDLEPSEDAGGRKNAWRKDETGQVIGLVAYPGGMPGLFAHGVAGLELSGLEVLRPKPLPAGWNPSVTLFSESPEAAE